MGVHNSNAILFGFFKSSRKRTKISVLIVYILNHEIPTLPVKNEHLGHVQHGVVRAQGYPSFELVVVDFGRLIIKTIILYVPSFLG